MQVMCSEFNYTVYAHHSAASRPGFACSWRPAMQSCCSALTVYVILRLLQPHVRLRMLGRTIYNVYVMLWPATLNSVDVMEFAIRVILKLRHAHNRAWYAGSISPGDDRVSNLAMCELDLTGIGAWIWPRSCLGMPSTNWTTSTGGWSMNAVDTV